MILIFLSFFISMTVLIYLVDSNSTLEVAQEWKNELQINNQMDNRHSNNDQPKYFIEVIRQFRV